MTQKLKSNQPMNRSLLIASIMMCVFTCLSIQAENEYHSSGWENCACKKNLFDLRSRWNATRKLEKPPGNGRQYARHRIVDVKHQKIEFTPDFKNRNLTGIATVSFAPIARPLESISLDAFDLKVEKVETTEAIDSWDYDDSRIAVYFKDSIPADKEVNVTVHYSAQPKDGLFFRTEAMGYPKGDDHLWTQGEPEKHRYWFPGYDFPNERFTSEVICHVPEAMTVLSNGDLISDTVKDGLRTVHWHQKQEHVNYLISVIAGYFNKLEDKHGELDLAFFTTPSNFDVAENSFRDTAKILDFMEKEIGREFPWAKYYNVCVADFIAGGMENTSISTLSDQTLFSADSGNLRSSHRLDAHEVAHQWFGDLLTCKDWSNLWLNEGFATYYTHLYENHKSGRDDFLYGLYKDNLRVTSQTDGRPIYWRRFSDPWEQFDYRAYPKGSWVLHMLRCELGAELYKKCVKTYLNRNENTAVETSDLKEAFEDVSGLSLDEFFDQWVYHGGTPILDTKYSWDGKKKQAKLEIKQSQKLSASVLLFDFELPVRFVTKSGEVIDRKARVQKQSESFVFDLPEAAAIVRIDPGYTVLAKVNFKPSTELLHNQLAAEGDMMGRLFATQALASKKDSKSVELLAKRLAEDSFYGVRIEAAKSLAKHRTPAAFAVLSKAVEEQKDDRVRIEVTRGLGKFYSSEALKVLKSIIETEANPEIVASAIGALGKYPFDQVNELLMASLNRESYRHQIAVSAIRVLRSQAAPENTAVLLKHLVNSEAKFTTRDFGQVLDSLAYLAREAQAEQKDKVREYLGSQVNTPKEKLRANVIKAMGTLRDPKALPLLSALSSAGDSHDRSATAAKDAIKAINGQKKQADEVKDLRSQLLKLQQEVKKLSSKVK